MLWNLEQFGSLDDRIRHTDWEKPLHLFSYYVRGIVTIVLVYVSARAELFSIAGYFHNMYNVIQNYQCISEVVTQEPTWI